MKEEEERERVSVLGNGPSPVPQGAMLTSSDRTGDHQSSMWLLWLEARESPWSVSALSPPGLEMVCASLTP